MSIIIHLPDLSQAQLQQVRDALCSEPEQADGYYRVCCDQAVDADILQTLRTQLACDVNQVPAGFDGSAVRLIVTDMDSTLIAIECIDEIADMLDLKPQVSAITESAMRGEIDFPTSLKKRVALLKGLPVSDLQRVYDERLRLNPGAETLLAYLKQTDVKLALVSGGFTFFTEKLKQRLDLDYTLSNVLGVADGFLTGEVLGEIVDGQAKADLLLQLQQDLGLQTQQIIAMGDGANDLTMMAEAGLSVAYHAKPTVQQSTHVQLNQRGLDAVIDLLKA